MPEKMDYKKEYKDLYMPGKKPMLIEVPPMHFIMVDGRGAPGGEQYTAAMQTLYALSFTIKMSKMGENALPGYFEYVVPPLEGLWWSEQGRLDPESDRNGWLWTSMIRQPEFVTKDIFRWAMEQCRIKKPEVDLSKARFECFNEGLCAQIMHIGSYNDEPANMQKIKDFIAGQGYKDASGALRKHHEIYLSDPRKTSVDKLKTVLRMPIEKA